MSTTLADPRLPHVFPTISGRRFDLLHPTPDMVDLGDIAHALARICRYGGHVADHYSVAQHSTLVLYRLIHNTRTEVPRGLALAALLHDAAEAYLGDVIRPLKALLPQYAELEARTEQAIAARFGIGPDLFSHPDVKAADMAAYAIERRDVAYVPDIWDAPDVPLPPVRLRPLDAETARREFLVCAEWYGLVPE